MTRARRPILGLIALGAVVAAPAPARAAPLTIRDEMISDPAITPVLGRGYSVATNTFQSTCIADAPRTKPSYNFRYEFQDGDALASGAGGDVPKIDLGGSGTYQDVTGKRWYRHLMRATIRLDVYYASVDDSKARLSDHAIKLLDSKDLPGFFDACGVYYTRSITRRSTYLSIFTYETETAERDTAFETALKNEITRFGPPAPPSATPATAPSIEQQITSRRTAIRSFGFGLGKGEGDLIAYDLKTFKDAVTASFKLMQSDEVGIVTSIEVIPWVENPAFQAQLVLPKGDVPPYTQKRILSQNSEFLTELDRSARARLLNFFRARTCKLDIERNYGRRNGDRVELGSYGSRAIINNRTQADPVPLATFYEQELSDARLQALRDEYDTFQYKTAPACLDALLTDRFTQQVFRTLAPCAGLEAQLTVVSGRAIDDYCMPTFARTGSDGSPTP